MRYKKGRVLKLFVPGPLGLRQWLSPQDSRWLGMGVAVLEYIGERLVHYDSLTFLSVRNASGNRVLNSSTKSGSVSTSTVTVVKPLFSSNV